MSASSEPDTRLCGILKKKGKKLGMWNSYYAELENYSLILRKGKKDGKILHIYDINYNTKINVYQEESMSYFELVINNDKIKLKPDYNSSFSTWVTVISSLVNSAQPDFNSFTIISTITHGLNGEILLARLKDTERYYALKPVEKVINFSFSHQFILRPLFTFQSQNTYAGYEYMSGGDLQSALDIYHSFSKESVRIIAGEVALALECLHANGIIHGNIEPESILIDNLGHIKLSGFGLSRKFGEQPESLCGTADYISPEAYDERFIGPESDWWAFGILVYHMLFGESPFHHHSGMDMRRAIKFNEPIFPGSADTDTVDFIRHFLTKDPFSRSTYNDISDHNFWGGITRDDLTEKRFTPRYSQ